MQNFARMLADLNDVFCLDASLVDLVESIYEPRVCINRHFYLFFAQEIATVHDPEWDEKVAMSTPPPVSALHFAQKNAHVFEYNIDITVWTLPVSSCSSITVWIYSVHMSD
jgi:hypothetical protein